MRNRNHKWVGVTLVYHGSRNGEAAVDSPARAGRSFPQSFHQALLDPTGAHWLDDPPDLSSKDSTRRYAVDDARLSCNLRRLRVRGLPAPLRGLIIRTIRQAPGPEARSPMVADTLESG